MQNPGHRPALLVQCSLSSSDVGENAGLLLRIHVRAARHASDDTLPAAHGAGIEQIEIVALGAARGVEGAPFLQMLLGTAAGDGHELWSDLWRGALLPRTLHLLLQG